MRTHILVALSLSALWSPSAGQKPYEVPLRSPYRISGTYAELRLNHYHSGLDMGTAGVENVPVHAAERGHVSRVKVGPYGYGKALYIDHPDGHTTVYGHLNGFAPRIDSLLSVRQSEARDYNVEFYPSPGELPVERGEVVAFSGNTGGSGGPHLHFEVRDTRSEEPLNPMRFIDVPPDPVAPALYGIKLYALSPDAQVAGVHADRYYTADQCRARALVAAGAIGVGVHCTDFPTAAGRPCGITEASLYDGDSLLCHWRVDHYSFDDARCVNAHFDYGEWVAHRRFVQKAFVSPGNRLSIYLRRGAPLDMRPGEQHRLRWELRDYAGNTTRLAFTLRGGNPLPATAEEPPGRLARWQAHFDVDTLGLGLQMEPLTLYDDTRIPFRRLADWRGQRCVMVGDGATPLDKDALVTMPLPDAWRQHSAQVGLVLAAKAPTWLGGQVHAPNGTPGEGGALALTAHTKSLGAFALAIDTVPPTVAVRNKSAQLRRGAQLFIGLADDLSGLATYSADIDGAWLGLEHDYKRGRLVGQLPQHLEPGQHTLTIVVSDQAGNGTTKEWRFTLL